MVWEYQAPGTRAGPGLISWQQASNWVRTMSDPWLWPCRDWITTSGDRQQGEGRGERERVCTVEWEGEFVEVEEGRMERLLEGATGDAVEWGCEEGQGSAA